MVLAEIQWSWLPIILPATAWLCHSVAHASGKAYLFFRVRLPKWASWGLAVGVGIGFAAICAAGGASIAACGNFAGQLPLPAPTPWEYALLGAEVGWIPATVGASVYGQTEEEGRDQTALNEADQRGK